MILFPARTEQARLEAMKRHPSNWKKDRAVADVIDVQVGISGFHAECECGWSLKTVDDQHLEAEVGYHESLTGHHWTRLGEAFPDE